LKPAYNRMHGQENIILTVQLHRVYTNSVHNSNCCKQQTTQYTFQQSDGCLFYYFQSRLHDNTATPHWRCYHNIYPTLSAVFPKIIIPIIVIIIMMIAMTIIITIRTATIKKISHWWSRYTQTKNDNSI
jgi:hypothetical protein